MLVDYHTHTPLCKHAEGEPEEYIDIAIAKGLVGYGITDHAPMYDEPFDDWRMLIDELPLYLEWIDRAKQHGGKQLSIKQGLECDWIRGCEKWTESLKKLADWDYLIGSVHYIGDKFDFDNPKWIGKWSELNVTELWKQYWLTYRQMVESGLFEVLGHPDLIKKFSFYPTGDLTRYYAPVIKAIAESSSVIEINTAGWFKTCKEQYPSTLFLELACEAGIGIVLSSDAHAPGEVGRDFDRAVKLAKNVGYTEVMKHENGVFSPVKLKF